MFKGKDIRRYSLQLVIGFTFTLLSAGGLFAQKELIDFGNSLLKSGKFEEAKIIFNAVALNYPEQVWQRKAKLGLGKALLGTGDTSSAITILNDLGRGKDEIALNALLTLTSLNDSELVAEANLKVATGFPEVENRKERLLSAYRTFRALGNLDRAIDVARIIGSDYSSLRKWAQLELAELYLKKGDFSEVNRITSRYPNEDRARLLRARVFLSKGDTVSAIEALSDSRTLPNLKLLAEIHERLGNFDGVLRTLSRFPDTLQQITRLKANAMLKLGMKAQLEDLIPYVKDSLFRAKIYLSLGYPDSALKILFNLRNGPDSLFVKAYLQNGDIFSAWTFWKKGTIPPGLSSRIATNLDSLGFHKLAVKIWHKLWEEKPHGEEWIPLDTIGTRLAQDLFLTGDTVQLRGVLDTLSKIGIEPVLQPPQEKIREILTRIARGTPLKEGVKDLISIHAYKEAISLLEGLNLDSTGMKLLGRAYLLAYEDGDSMAAMKLNQLFKSGLNDINLFMRFYSKFNPRLVAEIDPEKLPESLRRNYINALLQMNEPDTAMKFMKKFGVSDNDLLFEVYIRKGMVDSAYKHLDFDNPLQIYALAQKLYEKNVYDLTLELLDRVNLPGFVIDRDAKELALRSALELRKEEQILNLADELEKGYGRDSLTVYAKSTVKVNKDPQWVVLRLYTKKDPASMRLKARALFNSGHEDWAFRYADFDSRIKFIKALRESDVVTLLELPVPKDSSLILDYLRLLLEKDHANLASLLADSAVSRGLVTRDEILRVKGESLLKSGDIDGALSQVDLISSPEEKAKLYYDTGIQLMKQGKLERAKSMFFKAIQWGNAETRGYGAFKLATTLFGEKRYEESAEYYQMALELVQSDTLLRLDALHNLAVCYKQMDKPDLALKTYNQIIEEYPASEEYLDALISKGLLLMDSGEPLEAYKSFEEVEGETRTQDGEVELQFWMAQASAMLGNYADALSHYQRLYLFHPDAGQWVITAKVEAARILAILGQKDRALALYTQLLSTLPEDDPLHSEIENEIKHLKPVSK